jgi:hypothetical protein
MNEHELDNTLARIRELEEQAGYDDALRYWGEPWVTHFDPARSEYQRGWNRGVEECRREDRQGFVATIVFSCGLLILLGTVISFLLRKP